MHARLGINHDRARGLGAPSHTGAMLRVPRALSVSGAPMDSLHYNAARAQSSPYIP